MCALGGAEDNSTKLCSHGDVAGAQALGSVYLVLFPAYSLIQALIGNELPDADRYLLLSFAFAFAVLWWGESDRSTNPSERAGRRRRCAQVRRRAAVPCSTWTRCISRLCLHLSLPASFSQVARPGWVLSARFSRSMSTPRFAYWDITTRGPLRFAAGILMVAMAQGRLS
jgi:hypothetical protein